MIGARLEPTPTAVATAIDRIVRAVHPARIIAFGSRARGEHMSDSDVDLMVVLRGNVPGVGAADLYEAVGALGFSKDIVVSDEARLARLCGAANSVEAEASREGVTLYEHGRTDRAALEKICG